MQVSFILLMTVLGPLVSTAQQPGEETLRWNASKQLTWADYKASPNPASDAAASTTTYLGIEYHIDNKNFGYKISSSFSKTRSWGRHQNNHILAHEQGHFDIAEIFARKLNKLMSEYQFNKNSFKTDLRKIYQGILDEKESMQNRYDSETNHSINKDKQAEWQKTIAAGLLELKGYANY